MKNTLQEPEAAKAALADLAQLATDFAQQAMEIADNLKSLHEIQKYANDVGGKLYYSLWILFLGGFVLSLAPPGGSGVLSAHVQLIHAFRIIAVLGTVCNFLMQEELLNSTTGMAVLVTDLSRVSIGVSSEKGDVDKAQIQKTQKFLKSSQKSVGRIQRQLRAAMILGNCAEICAVAFLVLALVGSWNLLPGGAPK